MKQNVLLHIPKADTKTSWVTLSSNILKTFYSSERSTKCHLHEHNTRLERYQMVVKILCCRSHDHGPVNLKREGQGSDMASFA